MTVYDALAKARGAGQRVVLVTVVAIDGDVPSHPGAKLVVGAGGDVVAGTLGCSEFDTVGSQLALEAAAQGGSLRRHVQLDEHERALELFAEVHEPEPAVLVLGSNPVARGVARLARVIGRRVVLVAAGGDVDVAEGVEVRAEEPPRHLLAAPPGPQDAVLVSDHDAAWVDEALRIALASPAAYVAMLGSRRHAPGAVRRLRDAGVPEEHIARLRSPAGLDIGSRTPEEIGLSVVAEIIAVERGRAGGTMSVDWSNA